MNFLSRVNRLSLINSFPKPMLFQRAFGSNFVAFHGSQEELESTISGSGSKVLYFTASWCPPCRMIAPIFQKMSDEFAATKFVKIDIDEYGDAASAFNIRSVPTFVFMKDAQIKSQFSGANEASLRSNLTSLQQ